MVGLKEARAHLIPDAHKEAMDALVAPCNVQLRKHYSPLGVHGAVCDPVLLRQGCGRVDDELVSRWVIASRGLHLHCIVACMYTQETFILEQSLCGYGLSMMLDNCRSSS